MSATYTILFLGDVMGKPGRQAVRAGLESLQEMYRPLFTLINGENAAGGVGITPDIAKELLSCGADGITLGNHGLHKRDIFPFLDSSPIICRPANCAPGVPGKGWFTLEKDGVQLSVVNLCGRVFMDAYDDPFRCIDSLLTSLVGHVFIDLHAEATSEKVAFAWHVDGKVAAVVGTHTHVQTADERVLSGGTAAITDVGMCGPHNGVIGMDREIVLRRFRFGLPDRFEVADGPGILHGVAIEIDRKTGLANSIERIRFET